MTTSDPQQNAKPGGKRAGELWDGRWRIERELGRGTTGVVYLARDEALTRAVALKLLSPSLADQPEVVARFEREAAVMARLEQHPNVVTLLAHGRQEGVPYLVMEYVPGETLRRRLGRLGSAVSVDRLLEWATQIASALDFIHARGLVHRDLKPSNLFVDQNERVAVLDLGLALALESTRLTRTGSVLGSPAYISPEQAQSANVGPRSDLYSFGVVLFELATGKRPFEGASLAELLRAHTELTPPRASELNPAVPAAASEVLARCLAKRPEDRHGSAGEIVAALEQAYRPQPAPNAERAGKYRLLRKLAAGGCGEIFLAVAEGPMGFEKQVAVKRVLPHLSDNPKVVERFVREARLAARVNQPNVAQVYDFGVEPGFCFIAMEYVDGPSLRALTNHLARRGSPVPVEIWVKIVSQAAEGLAAVHAAGFLHRDLTPENILLSKSGVVKVVDFGLAKDLASATRSVSLYGKFGYVAPEQVEGAALDARCDIFSLGVVLYELVTGHKPFEALSHVEMLLAVLEAPLTPASTRNPLVPAELDGVLAWALDRDLEARFHSCAELQAALEGFLAKSAPISSADLAQLVADFGTSLAPQTASMMPAVLPPRPPTVETLSPAALVAPPPAMVAAPVGREPTRNERPDPVATLEDRHAIAHAQPGSGYGNGEEAKATRKLGGVMAAVEARLGSGAAPAETAHALGKKPSPSGKMRAAEVAALGGKPSASGKMRVPRRVSSDEDDQVTVPKDRRPPKLALIGGLAVLAAFLGIFSVTKDKSVPKELTETRASVPQRGTRTGMAQGGGEAARVAAAAARLAGPPAALARRTARRIASASASPINVGRNGANHDRPDSDPTVQAERSRGPSTGLGRTANGS